MIAKKILKITSNIITGLLFLLLILMIFVVISSKASGGEPQIFGFQLKTVLSGSMEPTFNTGSIIAIKPVDDPSSLKKDDVITFLQSDGNVVTHRIIEVMQQGDQTLYQTKGDNNQDMDTNLTLSQNVIGKYTGFTVPKLGYLVDFAKSSKGMATLLITPGILLLIYSGVTIFKALKELEQPGRNKDSEKTA